VTAVTREFGEFVKAPDREAKLGRSRRL